MGPELGYYYETDKGKKVYFYNKKFKDFERKSHLNRWRASMKQNLWMMRISGMPSMQLLKQKSLADKVFNLENGAKGKQEMLERD